MVRSPQLISSLSRGGVEFVVIGGVAAVAHGSVYVTWDLDLCYSRDHSNLEKLVVALKPFNLRLRGAPAELPFLFDAETFKRCVNLTLTCTDGDLDLLGDVPGLGDYKQARAHAEEMDVDGFPCLVLKLDALIATKRASGRPKDLALVPHLEALLEMRKRRL